MPRQSFTHSSTAHVDAETVWEALNHPSTWEAIGGVDRVFDPVVDEHGDLHGFSFESVVAGLRYTGTASPREREEFHLMSWDIANREVRGITSVELAPAEATTTITVTIEVASVGMMSTMFFPAIAAALGNGLPKAVDRFAERLSNRA
ncbi:MAG: SRPBCC family protein [Acidimicrobiia bacterium]